MNSHPAAFVPSREASIELRALWKDLHLPVNGVPQRVLLDGRRQIEIETQTLPALDATLAAGRVQLPWLYFDFYNFLALPPREISGAPSLGDKWLRMTLLATYELENRYGSQPIECIVDPEQIFTFDWVAASGGDPVVDLPKPSSEAGITAGVEGAYYFYLVRVTEGIITQRAPSALFYGWPQTSQV
jgi:hypothetical protein